MKLATAMFTVLLLAGIAHADSTTYTYVGNPLDDPGTWVNQPSCTCNVSGEMTFAEPLDLPADIETVTGTPTSYSFFVDGFVLNQNNSTIEEFNIGQLWWNLDIQGNNGLTIFTGCQDGCGDDGGATDWAGFPGPFAQNGIGVTIGNPGKWAVAIPEPATYSMLLAGIMTLLALRRCRIGANESCRTLNCQ